MIFRIIPYCGISIQEPPITTKRYHDLMHLMILMGLHVSKITKHEFDEKTLTVEILISTPNQLNNLNQLLYNIKLFNWSHQIDEIKNIGKEIFYYTLTLENLEMT